MHSGKYGFDFVVHNLRSERLCIGFMLELIAPTGAKCVNWGPRGVVGGSPSSWALDMHMGALINNGKPIRENLPKCTHVSTATLA